MRTGKALGLALGGVLALVVAVMAAVWLLVQPNDYKPRIVAAVREATGRDLDLKGDIRLSVFPWVALELGPASLGNPPGFDGPPFLSFTHASVRVRLLPLLGKRLEVGRVEVDGLVLHLARNPQGQANWQGLGRSSAAPTDVASAVDRPATGGTAWDGIEEVKLTHARVTYEQISLEDIDLETGSIGRHQEVPVSLHLAANRGAPDEYVSVDARFDVRADLSLGHFAVAALNMNGTAQLATHARTDHFGAAAAAIDIDLRHDAVAIPAITLNTDGAVATASALAVNWSDTPRVTGAVSLAPLVLREWMARFGLTVPTTRDPKALSSLTASTRVEYADGTLKLSDLAATLDETRITGSALVHADSRFAVDLAMDRIELDRYLPAATQTNPGQLAPFRQIHLSGRGSVDLKATGRGADVDSVLRSLDGSVDARITNGALEGVDLGFQLGRAEALLGRQSGPAAPDSGRTPFEAFHVSAQISGGVAATHDLLISTAALKITGQGTANLVTQALDLALLADTMKTLSGTPLQMPVIVRGTFANPDIRPDMEALARGELKEKVKDLLKGRLQELFGKP